MTLGVPPYQKGCYRGTYAVTCKLLTIGWLNHFVDSLHS